MSEEEKKAIENFKNFIKLRENEQKTLYENEEFYKDDIEQNELCLKMLHSVLNLIQRQQAELAEKDREIEKKDKIIKEMLAEYEYNERINLKDFCDEEMRKDTCIQDCASCIKQYFERKAEK